MIVVAERLSEIALAEPIEEHADSFGRSAFNRYYYASYLIIRDMLRQLDRSWTRTGHSEIPKLLAGEVIKRVRNELHRQEKARLLGSGKAKSILKEANTATAELSNLLKNAYVVRCVADYEPEEKIFCDGRVIKLGEHTIGAARNWPSRASIHTKTLIKIWRQLGLS
jgi:hypothetical protein